MLETGKQDEDGEAARSKRKRRGWLFALCVFFAVLVILPIGAYHFFKHEHSVWWKNYGAAYDTQSEHFESFQLMAVRGLIIEYVDIWPLSSFESYLEAEHVKVVDSARAKIPTNDGENNYLLWQYYRPFMLKAGYDSDPHNPAIVEHYVDSFQKLATAPIANEWVSDFMRYDALLSIFAELNRWRDASKIKVEKWQYERIAGAAIEAIIQLNEINFSYSPSLGKGHYTKSQKKYLVPIKLAQYSSNIISQLDICHIAATADIQKYLNRQNELIIYVDNLVLSSERLKKSRANYKQSLISKKNEIRSRLKDCEGNHDR